MHILGIDPGIARMGFAFLDIEGDLIKIKHCGIVETDKHLSQAARLHEVRNDLNQLIIEFKPEYMVVEKIFFFKNPKTIIPVAEVRGVILEVGHCHNLKIHEYTPLEMKKIITGNGVATKEFVSNIVHQYFKLKTKIKPDDAVDAVALALAFVRNDLFRTA